MEVMTKRIENALLIDDDDLVNRLNTIIIRSTGLIDNAITLESSKDALIHLEEASKNDHWPNVIFIDINMPGMSGWELLEEMAKKFNDFNEKCVICMLSSSMNPEDKQRADESELVDIFISKPLSDSAINLVCEKYCSK